MVFELLSPSTKSWDKRDKFVPYRSLATLLERELIDPVLYLVAVLALANAAAWLFTAQTSGNFVSVARGVDDGAVATARHLGRGVGKVLAHCGGVGHVDLRNDEETGFQRAFGVGMSGRWAGACRLSIHFR